MSASGAGATRKGWLATAIYPHAKILGLLDLYNRLTVTTRSPAT
jgi:hypothetical protein